MKWLAQSTIYRDCVDLVAVIDDGRDTRGVVQPVVFEVKQQDRHYAISEPTLSLPPSDAQSLLQALWDAGLRPNNGEGSGEQAKALRDHIKFAERMADGLLQRLASS